MPKKSFALPKKKKFPIHDLPHARNALARLKRSKISSSEKAKVKRAIKRRYPALARRSKVIRTPKSKAKSRRPARRRVVRRARSRRRR
jgi:hypothetical protein